MIFSNVKFLLEGESIPSMIELAGSGVVAHELIHGFY